ncbi:hypothetical protein REPUB_Repub03eG0239900 [Reevesia pubescens]
MKVYEESGCFDPHSITDCQALNSLEDNLNLSSFNMDSMTDCQAVALMGLGGGSATNSHNTLEDNINLSSFNMQAPVFRELLQSLPHGYTFPADHEREPSGVAGLYHDGDNGILEFSRDISMARHGKGREKGGKTTKHFATERERRVHLNDKYQVLRTMVPNPTKNDRASIVGDATDYIKELLRTVRELKLLVEKKRCVQERIKRLKTEDAASAADQAGDVECKPLGDPDQCYNTSLRSSWLQRKSKDSEVDVRIIDDEVTIKLVQRKKISCLLFVSRLLDELQLDLHHVAGGNIGDYSSFLFNTKIYEGSSVYASAIANKLIDVVDRQYAAAAPISSTCL